MNKFSSVSAVVAWSAATAFGQMPPGIPECKGSDAINYIEVAESDRSFYFDKTTVTNDYLLVGLGPQYLKLIEELKRFPQAIATSDQGRIESIARTHVIQESKNRKTSIFLIDKTEAVFTQWDLKADGAKICIPRDFINGSFDGRQGVLAVIVAVPSTTNCMWKFSWANEDQTISSEFYLTDTCVEGNPKITKAVFFDMMQRIVSYNLNFPPK